MENLSKEKQIEEMELIIDKAEEEYSEIWNEWFYDHKEGTKIDNEFLFFAKMLYDAGYRKSSEVAREIFEDIWRVFDTAIWAQEIEIKSSKALGLADVQKYAHRKIAIQDMKDYLRIVEKKYTEGEDEVSIQKNNY